MIRALAAAFVLPLLPQFLRAALLLLLVSPGLHAQTASDYLHEADNRRYLEAAIAAEEPAAPPPSGVTGITVPHHLLAADLIARGFWAASQGQYRRVILIGPDHFRLVTGRFATADAAFETVFGTVPPDSGAIAGLLARDSLFEAKDVWSDHALAALAPFVARFFPGAEVVPVLAAVSTETDDWTAAAEALAPLLGPDTLLVQSTDFSHFLTLGAATLKDSETLAAIATGDVPAVAALMQPDHLDSRAAMAIQTMLQTRQGAAATILANGNSASYSGDPSYTTSYLVAVWHPDPAATAGLRYPGQDVVYLGGDILLGRYFAPYLRRPETRAEVVAAILGITRGAPLIANLEGVLVDAPVANVPPDSHLMPAEVALPLLHELNIRAVSLANNHSDDFGEGGLATTSRLLETADIAALPDGEMRDIGPLRVLATNALPYAGQPDRAIPALCESEAEAPVVLFAHWGTEYTEAPTDADVDLARQAAGCAVSLIVGAHSHLASTSVQRAGLRTPVIWSMGNLIFDQSGGNVSGALVELRIFPGRTVAARLVPIPNLFRLVRQE